MGNELVAACPSSRSTEVERFVAGEPPLHPVVAADLDRIVRESGIRPGCARSRCGPDRRRRRPDRRRVRARRRSNGGATSTCLPATLGGGRAAAATSMAADVDGRVRTARTPSRSALPDADESRRGARHRRSRSAHANVRVWAGFGVDGGGAVRRRPRAASARFAAAAAADAAHRRAGVPRRDARPRPSRGRWRCSTRWARRTSCRTGSRRTGGAPRRPAADAAEVASLGARLSHLHVYEWAGAEDRRPLADGGDRWRAVLDAASALGGDRVAFLEFVAGDDPDALRRDAATLRSWLPPAFLR